MLDKMQRIRAYVANGSMAVKSETFMDATEDLVNYAILLKGLLIELSLTEEPSTDSEVPDVTGKSTS
jgi:hypothetical protein